MLTLALEVLHKQCLCIDTSPVTVSFNEWRKTFPSPHLDLGVLVDALVRIVVSSQLFQLGITSIQAELHCFGPLLQVKMKWGRR